MLFNKSKNTPRHDQYFEPANNTQLFSYGDNSTTINVSDSDKHEQFQWDLAKISEWIVIPLLCAFGILGNLSCLVVFFARMQEKMEIIEAGSICGMMGLAVFDFLFCLVTLCSTYTHGTNMVYTKKSYSLYVVLYSGYFINLFIKMSCWITMLMALYRHFAVANLIRSRKYLNPSYMVTAILVSVVFWTLLLLPMAWSWKTNEVACSMDNTVIFLRVGIFLMHAKLKQTFIYIWAIVGFILPVCTLVYCNINLILTVRTSNRRSTRRSSSGMSNSRHNVQLRMNITLISLIAAYFLLGLPGKDVSILQTGQISISFCSHLFDRYFITSVIPSSIQV